MSMRVIALIPAHNEEVGIADCLDALLAQTHKPDAIVVVADNCTDKTEQIAASYDVGVLATVGNKAKKAGALNQALLELSSEIKSEDLILVLDADSILAPGFIAEAVKYIKKGYAAVGGNFRGQDGAGFIGMCQRNEYARYARDVARLKGRCLVLTGTATVFRFGALQRVSCERGGVLPGIQGTFYDTQVLTEDNEMTFALRTLGYTVVSPKGCTLTTEVMPTWRMLAKQRLRWKRGAFENLRQYGFNRLTAPYWGRQVLAFVGIMITVMYLASLAYGLVVGMSFQPLWMGLSAIFAVERMVTVRERGWKMMVLGLTLIPEMLYDMFVQAVQAMAYGQAVLRRKEGW